ncbi:unnamed protein product [Closterium sp. Yama58-4]|nr:unnamed protein product [Closterium sp. Yama58-4]
MAAARSVVEHLVFFQVKPDTPADRVATFLTNLNALRTLPGVLYLSAGPALPALPAAPAGAPPSAAATSASPWTHALFGRYESRDALQEYSVSPQHVAVVTENVKPIISDIAAVDWETDVPDASTSASSAPPPHVSIHTAMIQWQQAASPDAIAAAVAQLKAVGGGLGGAAAAAGCVSVGENFSPARAKSFTWGLAVYAGDEAVGGRLWEQEACRAVLQLAERIHCVHLTGSSPLSS